MRREEDTRPKTARRIQLSTPATLCEMQLSGMVILSSWGQPTECPRWLLGVLAYVSASLGLCGSETLRVEIQGQ
jgi:hypothetical protein